MLSRAALPLILNGADTISRNFVADALSFSSARTCCKPEIRLALYSSVFDCLYNK